MPNAEYELRDHLGSTLRASFDEMTGNTKSYWNGLSYGYMQLDREYGASLQQRFGFNGKDNDNDAVGVGILQNYGDRMYNTGYGRFLSVDPLARNFASLSTYQFASSSPIANIDLDGREAWSAEVYRYKTTGEPLIISIKNRLVGQMGMGNKGGYVSMHDEITGWTYDAYLPDIKGPKPSSFDNWCEMWKKAAANDFRGDYGYQAVGQHVVPLIFDVLAFTYGYGEWKAAMKGTSLLQKGLTSLDLSLIGVSFLQNATGSDQNAIEWAAERAYGQKGVGAYKTLDLLYTGYGFTNTAIGAF